jgi:hypothetical protein
MIAGKEEEMLLLVYPRTQREEQDRGSVQEKKGRSESKLVLRREGTTR